MTSTSIEVISRQPCSNVQNRSLQQQYDENGEVIILEAVCAKKRLKHAVNSYYCFWSYLSLGLTAPCCLVAGKLCGTKAANMWRMYLTTTSIHLVNYDASCVCVQSNIRIDLTDIEEIQEAGCITIVNSVCINGSKIAPPTTILVELKPTKAKEFYACCYRCFDLPIVVAINYCENSIEFVEAVKQQMAILGQ